LEEWYNIISTDAKYVLRDGVIIHLDGYSLHISFGIWNYRTLSIDFKPSFNNIIKKLSDSLLSEGISIKDLVNENNLNDSEISELQDLFTQLQTGGFIYEREFIDKAIGGSFLLLGFSEMQTSSFNGDGRFKERRPKVGIFTTISQENLQISRYEKWLDITVIDLYSIPNLFQYDSTESTNATEILEFYEKNKDLSNFETIMVVLNYPHPTLLRNLNRLFIYYELPWIFASLDGPFIILTTFIPQHTACFECFELRITSQMRSIQEYKSFISTLSHKIPTFKNIGFTPILQIPISIAINELIMLSSFKANHFVGRLLSIYLPFFEIQMQDILRIPICPACGHTSKPTMNELYFDFRRFISEITEKIK